MMWSLLISVDCDVSTQYCQSSPGNEVEQINVQIHVLLGSIAIGWDSTAVISASYGSGSLWSVTALLSCCYVFLIISIQKINHKQIN